MPQVHKESEHMSSRSTMLYAVLLITGAGGCAGDTTGTAALREALQTEYPGANVEISFGSSARHMELSVDSAAWRNYQLATSELESIGESMARFVVAEYEPAALDSITIDFIQERSGMLFWKSWAFTRTRFAAVELR